VGFPAENASALSDYGVRLTDTVKIGGDDGPSSACSEEDITSNWTTILSESTSDTLSYKNTWDYSNNYGGSGWKVEGFIDNFRNTVTAGGGWGVTQVPMFETTTDHKAIRLYYFDSTSVFELVNGGMVASDSMYFMDFFKNPNASCRWQVWIPSGNITPTTSVDWPYEQVYRWNSSNIEYPVDYSGDSISSTQGGIITGNVQCANTNNIISAIQLNVQSGLDGNATITDDSMGGKNYRFYLWEESPYSLVVLCDGDPFYGPTVNSDLYNPYNWVCTHANDLDVCAVS
jgi:hypothetical protein